VYCSELQCALQCVVVCIRHETCFVFCCSVLQCVAVCCSVWQCVLATRPVLFRCSVCCSVRQCVLQCVAVRVEVCVAVYVSHETCFVSFAVCCIVCCSVLQCVLRCVAVCAGHENFLVSCAVLLCKMSHSTPKNRSWPMWMSCVTYE